MELEKQANIRKNKDNISLDYISDDGYIVNIYPNIEWGYELTNKFWPEIFINSFTDSTEFESVMNYMIEAEKLFELSNKICS